MIRSLAVFTLLLAAGAAGAVNRDWVRNLTL
jgi:hypothetical protein